MARLGDIAAHRQRAINLYLGTLARVEQESPSWASTQNNLGRAYAILPTGDRGKNLARAIAAFEAAYFPEMMKRAGGNISEAARQAGLDRSNFRRAAKRAGSIGNDAPVRTADRGERGGGIHRSGGGLAER